MVKCPECKNEISKSFKTWKYGHFVVNAYKCNNCNTEFREYFKEGKHSFTLKRPKKGRGYVKV